MPCFAQPVRTNAAAAVPAWKETRRIARRPLSPIPLVYVTLNVKTMPFEACVGPVVDSGSLCVPCCQQARK